ncbi:MAG TPA: hypothetical protein HPQ00_17775, partial [Magnetococcales bacterium]|nr:hypothetical protein [Magnetococcales bacterium]
MDKMEPELSDPVDTGKAPFRDELLEQMQKERSLERRVLEEMFAQFLSEQRRARRWKLFFRLFIVGYLVFLGWMGASQEWEK